MFYFISLMIIWLVCEKVLALITLVHMANVPPLAPIVMKKSEFHHNPNKKLPPIELSEWEKFSLIRETLKQGSTEFGISDATSKMARTIFQASVACQYIAILLTALLLIKISIS